LAVTRVEQGLLDGLSEAKPMKRPKSKMMGFASARPVRRALGPTERQRCVQM
jgi:hypothetical protein